jgi:hypothetical protein
VLIAAKITDSELHLIASGGRIEDELEMKVYRASH